MIWHITKRELYDNLNSLRFALATVLLSRLDADQRRCASPGTPCAYAEISQCRHRDRLNILRSRTNLYDIAQQGSRMVFTKSRHPLHFCADGGDIPFCQIVVNGGFVRLGHRWLKQASGSCIISTCDSQFKKYSSGHYQNRLGVCDRICLEPHRDPVHL